MRWGTICAADIHQLKVSHPDVHQHFMEGNLVVKTTHKVFIKVRTDMVLEHVNKVRKVAGCLIEITKSDTARDKWHLTYNVCLDHRRHIVCTFCQQRHIRFYNQKISKSWWIDCEGIQCSIQIPKI